MSIEPRESEVRIPSEVHAVVAAFADRPKAEGAVEALTKIGFRTDQISLVARGAEEVDGRFVPGTLMITLHATGREDEAERTLRSSGATTVSRGRLSATGAVVEEGEKEPEEATSS